MQELTINEVEEISGGKSVIGKLKLAFDVGYAIGEGLTGFSNIPTGDGMNSRRFRELVTNDNLNGSAG